MPLTEKGGKVMAAMKKQYGEKKGEQVFYASKNKGTLTGVDDAHLARYPGKGPLRDIREREKERHELRGDDDQHMGTAGGSAPKAGELRERPDAAEVARRLVAHCDLLRTRMDMFEKRKAQAQPGEVKPRTKDNMQPSNRHPKEI